MTAARDSDAVLKKTADVALGFRAAAELMAELARRPQALTAVKARGEVAPGVPALQPVLTTQALVLDDALDAAGVLVLDLVEALAQVLGQPAVKAATGRVLAPLIAEAMAEPEGGAA